MSDSTNLMDYTTIHEQLMKQLQDATDNFIKLTEELQGYQDVVANHNIDTAAHEDIRRMIEDGSSSVDLSAVDQRIAEHNTSSSSHADIRQLIEQVRNDTSAAQTLITKLISEHNVSDSAHADIREAINTINTKLGDLNVTELGESLQELWTYVHETVADAITALQNVDARHDALIQENKTSIETVGKRIDNISTDIATISSMQTATQDDIDDLTVKHNNLAKEEHLGLTLYDPDGPRMTDFKCTLQSHVANNKAVKFTFTGAKGKEDGNQVIISIKQLLGDYTINKYDNIEQDEELTFTAGDSNQEGDILDFIATVKDTTTQASCARIFGTMSARSISDGSISLPGLTDLGGVEPGASIKFTVSNLLDDGSGKYTYSFDPLQTGITFSPKSEGIIEGEEITIKVPEDAPRDTALTFNMTVHSTSGSESTMELQIHINRMPDLEEFTHNVPTVVIPGKSYQLKFSGVTSAAGNNATYAISSSDGSVTFTKTSNILANENCTMTVGSGIQRGITVTLTITTTDENNIHLTKKLSFKVNQLPVADTVTTNLSSTARGGQTIGFTITGGSDPDGGSIASYTIDPGSSSFVFSKTSGIATGESVNVTLPKVSADTSRSFTIRCVDDMGELSANNATVKITVTPVYIATSPNITSPANGAKLEYKDGVTVSWTAFGYNVDMS